MVDDLGRKVEFIFITGGVIVCVLALFFLLSESPSQYSCEVPQGWLCSDIFVSDQYLEFYLSNFVGFDYLMEVSNYSNQSNQDLFYSENCFVALNIDAGFYYSKNILMQNTKKFKVYCYLDDDYFFDKDMIRVTLNYTRLANVDDSEIIEVLLVNVNESK